MRILSILFVAVGLLIMLINVIEFYLFEKKLSASLDCQTNHLKLILHMYLILLIFFTFAYGAMLCEFCLHGNDRMGFFVSQILFWGSIFVRINLPFLRTLYQTIIETKLNETDALTGLLNTNAGRKNVEQALLQGGETVAVFMIDLDHFKQINDIYGHITGDEVIKKVAQVIRNSIRPEDIASRFGGDEFMLCILNQSQEEVEAKAKFINEQVMKIGTQYNKANLSSSIGISFMIPNSDYKVVYEDFINQADKALYHVKRSGKNGYHILQNMVYLKK